MSNNMKIKFLSLLKITFLFLFSLTVLAQKNQSSVSFTNPMKSSLFGKNFSLSYMSFFDGPGILNEEQSFTPNALGRPSDDGLLLNNNFSLRYNLTSVYALDFQIRTQWVMNNAKETEDFEALRWQSPRFGLSTTFFKTRHGKLTGAFNTDLPYFFPEPIGGGYIAQKRTTLLTPGFFAKYSWTPDYTRWSVFSLVQPRYYIYENRNVAEEQYSRAGFSPRLKNELTLSFSPSANYAFSDKLGLRFGTEVVYKKLVASGANPFYGTQRAADPDSKAWRLQALPFQVGPTYIFSTLFELSAFVQGYPISAQRMDKNNNTATFEETVSVGAWLSGKLF
jgi:hypothetical protein